MVAGFSRGAGRARIGRNAVLLRQAAGQAGFVLAVILTGGVAAIILKWGLGRARPNIAAADGAFTFAPIATSAGWASFPSGHAATTVPLAVGLGFLMPRLRLGFLALAFWVAASRAILGAHWASDVQAGVVLGAATAYALRRWDAWRGLVFAGVTARYRPAPAMLQGCCASRPPCCWPGLRQRRWHGRRCAAWPCGGGRGGSGRPTDAAQRSSRPMRPPRRLARRGARAGRSAMTAVRA